MYRKTTIHVIRITTVTNGIKYSESVAPPGPPQQQQHAPGLERRPGLNQDSTGPSYRSQSYRTARP